MEKSQILIPAPSNLIKQLASCNKSTRDRALRLLKNWLPSQPDFPDEDLKKLWKGLFYCVWHADKAPVQADLINSLSSLLFKLPLSLSTHYFSVFLLTMRREWSGVDSHRLDKFYLLIRRFLYSFFMLLKKNNWDLEVTRNLVGVLEEGTFFANDKFLGNGVNYHFASIFLEEFKSFLPVGSEVVEILFKCLFNVMGKCQDKILVSKVKSNVFDVLLKMGRDLLESKKLRNEVEGETLNIGSIGLTMGCAGKFFELGSSPECVQANRKVLFGLHEQFLKLEKDLEASGVEISIPTVENEEGEEVPMLIPIASGETEVNMSTTELGLVAGETEDGASVSKSSKKKKKVKKESDGSSKDSKKKKKKKNIESSEDKNEDMVIVNGDDSVNELASNGNGVDFNESVISNLQMQFEKVAAELSLNEECPSSLDSPEVSVRPTISKKRKRARSADGKKMKKRDLGGLEGKDTGAETGEKSAKKVRFAIKNNIVWKPHSPMPPQDLRLPPSVTPRGSALKKGLSPGPIREMPPATKKAKLKKKAYKGNKHIAPAVRRLRKLQGLIV